MATRPGVSNLPEDVPSGNNDFQSSVPIRQLAAQIDQHYASCDPALSPLGRSGMKQKRPLAPPTESPPAPPTESPPAPPTEPPPAPPTKSPSWQANGQKPVLQQGMGRKHRPPPPDKPLSLRTKSEPVLQQPQINVPGQCCDCTRSVKVWKCVQCDDSFCDDCWVKQRPHLPGKVGMDGRKHEKVDEKVVHHLEQIFHNPTGQEQDQRHHTDINTTWFGFEKDDEGSYLHYSHRLVEILQEQVGERQERFPQLVSFVGQTGAGKSTIVKMLIDRERARTGNNNDFSYPVPGVVGDNVPTTGNVHLYADPGTSMSQKPMLYADCEGMAGGENPPRGLTCCQGLEGSSGPRQLEKSLRRKLSWADTAKRQSREYAVRTLFPKILYTFSDVVVFTLREVRTFQSEVLKQLIEWGAASIDKSLNQPSLPHVIIIINATDTTIDERQWDPDYTTRNLLDDFKDSISQVPELLDIVSKLYVQNQTISTTEQLLKLCYSSVTVLRIPSKGRYMQIDSQVGKLYDLIGAKCSSSHDEKRKKRMALNAERLPQYANMAFERFSRRLEDPFDFVEAARRCAPLPQGFGGHILNLVLSLTLHKQSLQRSVEEVLNRLSPLIASCIMLATTRDNAQGSYHVLLESTYRAPLYECLSELSDNWLSCSYECEGVRCCNAKNTHSKGHQAQTGKLLSRGQYQSSFDPTHFFEDWMEDIGRKIGKYVIKLRGQDHEDERTQIYRMHGSVVATFYREPISSFVRQFKTHLTCLYCMRKIPESVLPCGHSLCKPCIQSLGNSKGECLFEMDCCPLHPKETRWTTPAQIRYKPHEAGVRVLSLDGGGVRGLVQLAILQAIEDELGGHIPVQNFFDLIVGTSTGGIIALGLGVKQWTVSQCRAIFRDLATQAFSERPVKPLALINHKSYYKTRPLESALVSAFDSVSPLYGDPSHNATGVRVAVTSTSASENQPVILSNYNTGGGREHRPYHFVRPREPASEFKVWEAARATSAAPPYFKPYVKSETMTAYSDGATHHNCPVRVADHERKLLWEDVRDRPADMFLSLGSGLSPSEASTSSGVYFKGAGKPKADRLSRRSVAGFGSLWGTANNIIDDQQNCEKIWDAYSAVSTPPARPNDCEERRRNIRLNIMFPDIRPKFDDVRLLETIEHAAKQQLPSDFDVVEVAHRLVASCFYFEKIECHPAKGTGRYQCIGNIQCRLPEGSNDLKGLGCILRKFTRNSRPDRSFEPLFILQEDFQTQHQRDHEIPIPPNTVQGMCDRGLFRLPTNLEIDGSFQASVTRIALCLQPQAYGQNHDDGVDVETPFVDSSLSISGFPRELWTHAEPLSPSLEADDEKRNLGSPKTYESPVKLSEAKPVSDPIGKTRTAPGMITRFIRKSTSGGGWSGSSSENPSMTSLPPRGRSRKV